MSGEVFARIREGLRLRNPISYRRLLRLQQSGGRAGFIRVGENLYLAGDEGSITNFVDPNEVESYEDVIYENQGVAQESIEQIQLDEIEINDSSPLLEEFSATPGLAEAGGFAGAGSVAAAPSAATVITSVGITAGIITIGTGVTLLSSDTDTVDHEDPVVSLPDHRYIGPGNTIDDTEPVDLDDDIAREHDINYEKAKTQEDVQEADREGAGEFLTDVIHNSNPHSIAGYIGLKAKEKVESVIGVQYPANLPISSSGMATHHVSRRALGKYDIDRDPSRHPDFPQSHGQQQYAWAQWNRARQRHNLPRVDPPPRFGWNVTQRPRIEGTGPGRMRPSSNSISFRDWKNGRRGASGPLIDGFNRQREQQNARNDHLLNTVVASELSESERMEVDELFRQATGGSISLADFDNTDGAGPSSSNTMDTRSNKRAHEGPQGGSVAPANPAAAASIAPAAGAGHNSQSDGGFDSAQGPVTVLPKGGYSATGGTMMFKKVHRMKSYAIPYWNLADETAFSGANLCTTPLAKIPWEKAPFYTSPEEFALIPAGSYIKSVSIDVMQTVATTGYPTGGTTSSVATTNHPKVICIGKDLERKMRGGVDRTLTIADTMIPTAADDPADALDDFIAKQYGTDQSVADTAVVIPGCAHKIPYYNRTHFCIYQPNKAQATARGFTAANAPGYEYFQNCITEMNSNDSTWDHVDSMHYNFVNAPIGEQYQQLEIQTDDFRQATGNARYYNASRNVNNIDPNEEIKITESYLPSSRATVPVVTYKSSPMEQGCHFVRGDSAGKPARQPSYHIGMRAIDKQSPSATSSRAADFVQANIEFEITATMIVQLPSYPNRFVKPKFYNTSLENAVQGIGLYPEYGDKVVTFNLLRSVATAPTRNAVDQTENNEPTEDNMVPVVANVTRPRRSLPRIVALKKKAK
ncbi:structural protein [Sea star-associated densovirus]|uniref:Structural protein n=3 Tax=Densovirinae TaxID=40120 RepID=A0A0A0QLR1_9VIRU|nr:structural protein [Sea star-associated densovirus]AIQ82698.1 structural protein [Sea star-associated densovirus]QOD39609.1 VP [uncultured densovirus]